MLLMKVTDVLIITEKTSSKSHQSYQPETVLHRTSLYYTQAHEQSLLELLIHYFSRDKTIKN